MSMNKSFGAAALWLAAASLLVSSCATSSGSAYSKASSAESAAARQGRSAEQNPQPSKPDRDDSVFVWVQAEEDYEPTGNLILSGLEPGSSVYVDGSYHSGWKLALGTGSHELRIELYGYEDFTESFEVFENGDTIIEVRQYPAPFRIQSARATPASFDPHDPGHLGSCKIVIETSAPGEGRLSILDASGSEARSLGAVEFTGRFLTAAWDGRDGSGTILGPGVYALVVEGAGESVEDRAETAIEIVSGKYERTGLLHDGVSGALLAPDARCLDAGRLESISGALFHVSPEGRIMAGLGILELGARLGLPAKKGLELGASGMMVLWPGDPVANSASLSMSLKGSLTEAGSARAAAWYVKGTFASFISEYAGDALPSWDGATRYAGLSAGLPLEIAFSRARLFVAPELQVSGYYPNWARSSAPFDPPGLFAWGYLRAGIEASVSETITASFSSALRTKPFSSGLGVDLPLPLGVEVSWHSRSAPVTITFAASGEVESPDSYYFGGGVFASFRF